MSFRDDIATETNNVLDWIDSQQQTNPSGQVIKQSFADITEESSSLTGAGQALIPFKVTIGNIVDPMNPSPISFTMLINPSTINYGNTNATQLSYTRQGWVSQLWGPNLMTISSNGISAGFMLDGVGMVDKGQRRSLAFKNVMALMASYRNNGVGLTDPFNIGKRTRVARYVTGIQVQYDSNTLLGHFSTFTLDDSAEHPYYMEYNFEYIVGIYGTDYSQVRGHFMPVPELTVQSKTLVGQVNPNGNIQ
jgi:hypothetical protein